MLWFGDLISHPCLSRTDILEDLWYLELEIHSWKQSKSLTRSIFSSLVTVASLDKKFDSQWNFVSRFLVWVRGRAGLHNWPSWRPRWRARGWGGGGGGGWGGELGWLGRWLGVEKEEEEGNPFIQVGWSCWFRNHFLSINIQTSKTSSNPCRDASGACLWGILRDLNNTEHETVRYWGIDCDGDGDGDGESLQNYKRFLPPCRRSDMNDFCLRINTGTSNYRSKGGILGKKILVYKVDQRW